MHLLQELHSRLFAYIAAADKKPGRVAAAAGDSVREGGSEAPLAPLKMTLDDALPLQVCCSCIRSVGEAHTLFAHWLCAKRCPCPKHMHTLTRMLFVILLVAQVVGGCGCHVGVTHSETVTDHKPGWHSQAPPSLRHALPLQDVFDLIEHHFSARQAISSIDSQLEQQGVIFRSIQKRLLVRYKVSCCHRCL